MNKAVALSGDTGAAALLCPDFLPGQHANRENPLDKGQ